MEELSNQLSEIILSEKNIRFAQLTLGQLEEKTGASVRDQNYLNLLSDFFSFTGRKDLEVEAIRISTKLEIDELLTYLSEKSYITPEKIMHTLQFPVRREARVGIIDACLMKLTDFVGYAHEVSGNFSEALRFYATAHPEKYREVEGAQLAIKKEFNFSEATDDVEQNKLVTKKFNELTSWLSTETTLMNTDPEEALNKLLGEARITMAKAKKE